jgi:hypothetical protein
MLRKLDNIFLLGILCVTGFVEELKKDEKGMEVVQVVLLVLISVLAVVLIWGFLSGWLADLFANILNKAGELE